MGGEEIVSFGIQVLLLNGPPDVGSLMLGHVKTDSAHHAHIQLWLAPSARVQQVRFVSLFDPLEFVLCGWGQVVYELDIVHFPAVWEVELELQLWGGLAKVVLSLFTLYLGINELRSLNLLFGSNFILDLCEVFYWFNWLDWFNLTLFLLIDSKQNLTPPDQYPKQYLPVILPILNLLSLQFLFRPLIPPLKNLLHFVVGDFQVEILKLFL